MNDTQTLSKLTNLKCNQTVYYEKPDDACISNHMKLSQSNLITIGIYSIIFVLSSICNLAMLSYLVCKANILNKTRVNRLMLHLTIANLMITFLTIPMEIGWKWTVYWRGTAVGCKFFQFLRPVGTYLTSFIIVSLCVDW